MSSQWLHLFSLLTLSLLLSNCAVINNSFYQTPETVSQNHFKLGCGLGTGIDLVQSKLLIKQVEIDSINSPTMINPLGDLGKLLLNLQLDLGYGITNRLEADSKLWIGAFGSGARLGLKYRFTPIRSTYQFAIIPGISYYHNPGDTVSFLASTTNFMPKLHSINYEMPLIFGIFFSRQVSLYLIPNYSFHQMDISKWFSPGFEKEYGINDFGCTIGLSLKYRSFYCRPEFRYNALKGPNDFVHVFTCGLGLGLEFIGHSN